MPPDTKRIEILEADLELALEYEAQGYRPQRASTEIRAELERLIEEQEAAGTQEAYCCGRNYYGPFAHNFVWTNIAALPNDEYFPRPEQWARAHPNVSAERLEELRDDRAFPDDEEAADAQTSR